MKKNFVFGIIISVLVLIGASILVISSQFYFNPISFNDLGLVNNNWYDYKKVMDVELEYWNTEEPENFRITQSEDLIFIYNELAKSGIVTEEDYGSEFRYVWFFIREKNLGNIILHVDVDGNGVAKIQEDLYLMLTKELLDYLVDIQESERYQIQ